MWDYTDKVMDHFLNPRNVGEIENADAVGQVGSVVCGDALKITLKIEEEKIVDAKFKTFGCASAIASSSALTELLKGKTLEQAQKISNDDIAQFLGGLPDEKMHCSVMGQEALEEAFNNYYGKTKDTEKQGRLICECFGVYEEQIERTARENNLTEVEQIVNYTKAGGGCGRCKWDIEKILEKLAEERRETGAPKMTNIERMKKVMETIEKEIKPALAQDGGSVELVDIDGPKVYVKLLGTCNSCPSASITLENFIQGKLREFVDDQIEVINTPQS